MSYTFLLNDFSNLFFRMRHVASKKSSALDKVGMALHLAIASTNKAVQRFGVDHVVIMLEGRSWRKDFYKPYKQNRVAKRAAMTEEEREEDQLFWETYDELTQYFIERTNCTVIQCPVAEADDCIARFCNIHLDHKIIINSTDGDYDQLINERISRFNGSTEEYISIDGFFDKDDNPILDKEGMPKILPAMDYILFEHCMRGDSSDNVFSAYPGVRVKGTKKKVGLLEAYEDRDKKGYAWNNIMQQTWTDHTGAVHLVGDDYLRNKTLVDLNAQPDTIKDAVDFAIVDQCVPKNIGQVGTRFMQFCGKHQLKKLEMSSQTISKWLSSPYPFDYR